MYKDTDEELTTSRESDIGEESEEDEYSAFVLTLSDSTESFAVEKKDDLVEEKDAYLL